MLHLKRNPPLPHANPFTHKTMEPIAILNSYSRIPLLEPSHCSKLVRANSSYFVLDEHLLQTTIICVLKLCYKSVHCCLIRCILVRTRIAKCFQNGRKLFQCEVMFENKHTFCSRNTCSNLHRFWTTGVDIGLATRETLTRG